MRTFTPAQKEAIETQARDSAIVAGPGSGKTSVLVERICRLIRYGFHPSEIVAITFTNVAAREIEKRIAEQFPNGGIALGYAGTLHGYILRLLKAEGWRIRLPKNISMLAEDDADQLKQAALDEVRVKATKTQMAEALAAGPSFYLEDRPQQLRGAQLAAAHYYRSLLLSGVMDFDALLSFGVMLLDRMLLENCPHAISFLFWDEAQDSGPEDWRIMERIRAGSRMIVGDPDQSIYGFRGAAPEKFFAFITGKTESVLFLDDNFRCRQNICRAANALISRNPGRVDKATLAANDDDPGKVIWEHADSEEGELAYIAETIRLAEKDGIALSEMAVLSRFQVLVDRFAKGLAGYGIPIAHCAKTEQPLDWKAARAFISLMVNPENDTLMYWWLARLNGKPAADKIRLDAMRAGVSIRGTMTKGQFPLDASISDLPGLMVSQGLGQESIVRVQAAAANLAPGATLVELAYALSDEDLHKKEQGKGVTVTTYHSAKGREWDMVILPAFEDGQIPNRSKRASEAEERRLAFVGITRARRKLIVTTAAYRAPLFGRGKPEETKPSPFLDEMRSPALG